MRETPRGVRSEQDGEDVSDLTPEPGDEPSWLDDLDELVSRWDDDSDTDRDDVAEFDDVADPTIDDDDDLVLAGADADGADDDGVDQVVDLALDDDPGDAPDLVAATSDPTGACDVTVLVSSLELVGIDASALFDPFGEAVEPGAVVATLDEAGVAARLEYATIGDLAERVAVGVEVVLGGGTDGDGCAVVEITPEAIIAEPLGGGPRFSIALDRFEQAWEELANEALVVEAGAAGLLGTTEVVVVALAPDSLV